MTPERLAEIHGNIDHHLLRIVDLADLLAAHEDLTTAFAEAEHAAFGGQALVDRLREEKDALTAQVAALHAELESVSKSRYDCHDDRWTVCCDWNVVYGGHRPECSVIKTLADTAATAEAFKRQQRLALEKPLTRLAMLTSDLLAALDTVDDPRTVAIGGNSEALSFVRESRQKLTTVLRDKRNIDEVLEALADMEREASA